MSVEERLAALGKSLPGPTKPVANYLGVNVVDELMYVSGHVSTLRGEVGTDLDVDAAKQAAEEAVLACLGTARAALEDFDRVRNIVRLVGYVRVADDFSDMPQVVNGASDLLVQAFGERGEHARAAVGVKQLPFGAAVEIEMIIALASS